MYKNWWAQSEIMAVPSRETAATGIIGAGSLILRYEWYTDITPLFISQATSYLKVFDPKIKEPDSIVERKLATPVSASIRNCPDNHFATVGSQSHQCECLNLCLHTEIGPDDVVQSI